MRRIKVYSLLTLSRNAVVNALRGLGAITVAPPVGRYDLIADADAGVDVVAIIDGKFHQSLAVSATEILDVMRAGTLVVGAASMGALRAAELEGYGMIGVGKIYELIKTTPFFKDDWVGQAVYTDGEDWRPASQAFVDFYFNVQVLERTCVIDGQMRQELIETYDAIYYAERTFERLATALGARFGPRPELRAAARRACVQMPSQKTADARALLGYLRRYLQAIDRGRAQAGDRGPGWRGHSEIGSQRAIADLVNAQGRLRHEHREPAAAWIEKLLTVMPNAGVSRVGDISGLAEGSYPVVQSARPLLFSHPATGQNSGGQGKGSTSEHAKLTCLMETLEGYAMEPRTPVLIRGTHRALSQRYAIVDPRRLQRVHGQRPVTLGEPLMWTWALDLGRMRPTLVPAEAVYFPFFPLDYDTRRLFPSGSSGVAAGRNHMEAATHAIYETIERHTIALAELGDANIEGLDERDIDLGEMGRAIAALNEYELQLSAVSARTPHKLPVVVACLVHPGGDIYAGFGCDARPGEAVRKACSEALQGMTTFHSAAREDLDRRVDFSAWPARHRHWRYPTARTLSFARFCRRFGVARTFATQEEEFGLLCRWLERAGFPTLLVANLTRIGVDVPAVRVIIPGTKMQFDQLLTGEVQPTSSRVRALAYRLPAPG